MVGELSPARHLPGPYPVASATLRWDDARRGRTLPLRYYQPAGHPHPALILYSPGLGGSADSGARWLNHWASHGFFCLALQHPGSDAALFAGQPASASRRLLRAAMTREQLQARCDDLAFVLAEVAQRAAETTPHAPPLWSALAGSPRALAGQSFGAITVQAVAGEQRPDPLKTPPRSGFAGFLALSPSARGDTTTAALEHRFGDITAPFFSITGSADHGLAGSDIAPENRCLPYAGMPAGNKYLLVLDGARHPHFAGEAPPSARRQLAAAGNAALLAASTAFWQACLGLDPGAATHWLRHQLASHLAAGDHFVWK